MGFFSQPTITSDTNNMLGLKVAVCVCIIFIKSIEAAPQPDPSPCWPVELCPHNRVMTPVSPTGRGWWYNPWWQQYNRNAESDDPPVDPLCPNGGTYSCIWAANFICG